MVNVTGKYIIHSRRNQMGVGVFLWIETYRVKAKLLDFLSRPSSFHGQINVTFSQREGITLHAAEVIKRLLEMVTA